MQKTFTHKAFERNYWIFSFCIPVACSRLSCSSYQHTTDLSANINVQSFASFHNPVFTRTKDLCVTLPSYWSSPTVSSASVTSTPSSFFQYSPPILQTDPFVAHTLKKSETRQQFQPVNLMSSPTLHLK